MQHPPSTGDGPNAAALSPGRLRRQRWIEAGLVFAFWACIFMLTVGQQAFDPRGRVAHEPPRLAAWQVLAAGIEYLIWLVLTPGIFWLARHLSPERGARLRRLALHVFAAVAAAVVLDAVGHFLFHLLRPQETPGRSLLVGWSLVTLRFIDELIVYLVVLSAGFARDYFLRYQERQREAIELRARAAELHAHAVELQAQLAEARFQALRMQINPHFLFNTLHTISTYLERDPRGVRRMIARLSELLRYTLEQTDVKEVPLRQELAFLDGYFDIQRIRFEGNLHVERHVEPEVLEALVPNLILQPIVENAIKHGVGQREEGGRIELRAWRTGERLNVSVRDNGPGLGTGDGAASAPGIGLRNTRARLESLYGPEQSLVLAPAEGGGLVALVSLPYHTSADLYTTALPA